MRLNASKCEVQVVTKNLGEKHVEEERISQYDLDLPCLGGNNHASSSNLAQSWVDVSTQNRSTRLEFVQPVSEDGKKMVVIPEEEVADEVSRWQKAVVVFYVLGAKLPYHVIKHFLEINRTVIFYHS